MSLPYIHVVIQELHNTNTSWTSVYEYVHTMTWFVHKLNICIRVRSHYDMFRTQAEHLYTSTFTLWHVSYTT